MATTAQRLPTNVAGDFYVDSTCIDCDACRWIAPRTFDRAGDQSRVHRQPASAADVAAAERALVACPTGSIKTDAKHDLTAARTAFPFPIDEDVFHCGWHAESSFGATSYLVQRPSDRGGNVLVDSPRWSRSLVRRLEELGGVRRLFLTHGDDLADQERYAAHFGATRVMHAAEAPAGIEQTVEGIEPAVIDPELTVIPTPGHTRGSACLLYRERYLFTGDHIAFSPSRGHVYAFRDACWYDWQELIRSVERLSGHRFEWILPGHGRRCRYPAERMPAELARCVAWMRSRQ
jgi:glyoxylase-like metal-dependent hydrolase (beta-lactamase superfamily II)/ferredoxin